MAVPGKSNNVSVSTLELELLEAIHQLGPCSSEDLYEHLCRKFELLFVMRSLHSLFGKGFLRRIVINHKQLYRTARNYAYIKGYGPKSN